jgi:hypothetical protein
MFSLGACAVEQVATGMRGFQGRSIDDLVARVGYPDRQERVIDKTAYYWGTAGVDDPNAATCQLKAVAGEDKIIVDTSVYGNPMGCEATVRKLR